MDAFRDLHLVSPRSVVTWCFESVSVGYLSSLSPSRDSEVTTLCAYIVCTFLGYQIQNRPRNMKTTGFLLAPSLVCVHGWVLSSPCSHTRFSAQTDPRHLPSYICLLLTPSPSWCQTLGLVVQECKSVNAKDCTRFFH